MNVRHLLLSTFLVLLLNASTAQVKTITLKKGEALDLLLMTINEDATDKRKEYLETAVPIAQKQGYRPQYSSRIKQPPTQGNYWPELVLIAKWEDYDKRVQFLEDIVEEYPTFHEKRRVIWPTFNLTYWKVEEDQEVHMHSEKFYVATSYWSKDPRSFGSFTKDWVEKVNEQKGKIILTLNDGTSPFGYRYDPDLFTITEWESKEAFEKFHAENLAMDHTGVQHVNQFILQ